MRRKSSDLGSGPPTGRLRLTILLATVAAFLLIPASAQAFETLGTLQVQIEGTGSGEVSSVGGFYSNGEPSGLVEGVPPIECSYSSPGPASGVCEDEMEYVEFLGGALVGLHAVEAPGSELTEWRIEEGGVFNGCNAEDTTTWENGFEQRLACNPNETEGGNAKVTAVFQKSVGPALTLKVEEGSGTVVSNPAGLLCTRSAPGACTTGKIAEGTHVVLTASPAPGYAFKSWKGCDVGGVNGRQCTVTLSAAKTVGAKFYKTWNLTGSKSNPNGIFSTSPGGVNCGFGCTSSTAAYKEGSLTLKAKPAKNFHFVEFANGSGSAESCNGVSAETCTFSISADSGIQEVYAENAKNPLSLVTNGGGQGSVKTKPANVNCGFTCSAASAEFFANEEPEITVALNKGTTQVTWTTEAGTCTGHVLTCKVPMGEGHFLVAKFE